MLYTIGKIFFPTMLHREKELRARMRWVTVIFGTLLVAGVVVVIFYVQNKRPTGPMENYRSLRQNASQGR